MGGRRAPRALFPRLPFVVDDLDDLSSSLALAAVPSRFASRTALADLRRTSVPLRSPFAPLQGARRARLAGPRPHRRRAPIATHRPRRFANGMPRRLEDGRRHPRPSIIRGGEGWERLLLQGGRGRCTVRGRLTLGVVFSVLSNQFDHCGYLDAIRVKTRMHHGVPDGRQEDRELRQRGRRASVARVRRRR